MILGLVKLYCPICGISFYYGGEGSTKGIMHSRQFGIVCSRKCWELSELKYARMILGKDDE